MRIFDQCRYIDSHGAPARGYLPYYRGNKKRRGVIGDFDELFEDLANNFDRELGVIRGSEPGVVPTFVLCSIIDSQKATRMLSETREPGM